MNRALGAKLLPLLLVGLVANFADAQTINTTCTLYPGTAYCTSTSGDGGAALAAQARQQQYEIGQAIGSGIGMAIFRAHFPGWRRNYCSKHPGQPFYYGNAHGDSITGNVEHLHGSTFMKIHRTLRTSPAIAAGVTDRLWDVNDLVALWESYEQRRAERGA